jgi:hypothetical protein
MATKGAIDLYVNALPEAIRYPIRSAFYHLMDNWRLGDGARAENAQWYAFETTTPAVANTEFSIAHGLGAAPGRLIPVLRLNEVGDELVPLRVSRAADAERVYLTSASTSAVCSGFLEL